jgi:hypothetical protein
MKNKILLTIAILGLINLLNAQDCGQLQIRNASSNHPKFIVSINGVRVLNDYSSQVIYPCLDDFNYKVKILQAGSSNVLSFSIASEPRYISKYIINKDTYGNFSIILESKSLMLDTPEIPTVVTTPTVPVQTPTVAATSTGRLAIATNTTPAPVTPTAAPTPTVVTVTNMETAEFEERLAAVKKVSFDKDRLAKAEQVFDDANLSTAQVMTVVKAFSFDDSRLAFAKWAYKITIDKKNYYKVEDVLIFGNSKAALRDYVKKQPK